MNFIDLFSGCGGLSLGFQKAGFKCKGFVEFWKPAIETMLANGKGPLIKQDIRELTAEDCKHLGDIDVVVGGPPCQGFSMAGERKVGDIRNSLFEEFLRVVDIVKPKFCLMENVKGIYTMKSLDGDYVFNKILKEFEKRGYVLKVKLLNSANYNVPQKRNRVIFVANRIGVDFEFPEPTGKKYLQGVFDLPFKENEDIQHVYSKSPKLFKKGFYLRQGEKISSFGSAGIKLKETFAPTITKTGRYIHPKQNRLISVRESARIQTFPDDYRFCGSLSDMYGQIGNAVPVNMAKAIADKIKNDIQDRS